MILFPLLNNVDDFILEYLNNPAPGSGKLLRQSLGRYPGILTDEVKWDDYGVKGSPLQHSNRTDLDRTLS